MDIKIRKYLWDKIVSGEKTMEFRKLLKGITTGTHRFISIEKDKQETIPILGITFAEHTVYGTATLEPIMINPDVWERNSHLKERQYVCSQDGYSSVADMYVVDYDTYCFVLNNYKDKHDFIGYLITNVEEA